MDEVFDAPWTRKHDDPRAPLLPVVPRIVYPRSLADVRALLADPGQEQLSVAGSHWALSRAAISDHTFIETHDPHGGHPAMGATLTGVLPGCLNPALLDNLGGDGSVEDGYLVHVEAGKRIYQAYAELDTPDPLDSDSTLAGYLAQHYGNQAYAGPWAFETLGGAGGQTVVGALSTGTHGGDFDRSPLADAVQALHLVTAGGAQYWIERERSLYGLPLTTDDKALQAVYGDIEVKRDDAVFDAVLVSAGRFGVIYSVVLRVVKQYALREIRLLTKWDTVKSEIKELDGDLYDTWPTLTGSRFLQLAVCLTPHADNEHRVGVTRRWAVDDPTGQPGAAERVGTRSATIDPQLGAYRYSQAGVSHSYSPDGDPLAQFCADGSFVLALVDKALKEIDDFVASNGTVVGAGIAAVAVFAGAVAGAGLLALLAILALLAEAVRALVHALAPDARLGEVLNVVKGGLLDPDNLDPASRAAGVFIWRLIAWYVFGSQQDDHDYTAQSYAVMDLHDYLDQSCNVNVDSIEVFFDATKDDLVVFVDELLAFEASQEHHGRAFVGYASLRFTGRTRALLGPQRWDRTCAIEVACLRDVDGGQQLIDYAATLALKPDFTGVLHWGQRNDAEAGHIVRAFGQQALDSWRQTLRDLTLPHTNFSNAFTRRTGLEP